MKLSISKNVNYIGWIVIILAFILLYYSYFFVYIPRQEVQLQQRAFRILKEYGSNMFDKNDYYKNHFKNYKLYYTIRFNLNSNKIEKKDTLEENDKAQLDEIQKVTDNLYPYVDNGNEDNEKLDAPFVFSTSKNKLFINFGTQLLDPIEQEIKNDVSKYYKNTNSKSSENIALKDLKTYKVPIDTFMNGLKFDGLFENIILLDSSHVYYNSRLELVSDITNPKALADSVKDNQGGIWVTLNIRGLDKHVMVLPVDFLGKRFYLAGLITHEDYKTKTRTINSDLLILIATLLLLVLVGMPILKIVFIDKNERLNSFDVSGSAISTIFGTGLLILIIIGIIKHQFVDHPKLSERITQISNTLITNVNSDINSVKNLYISISDSCPKQPTALSIFTKDKFFNEGKKFDLYNDTMLNGLFPLNEIILIDTLGIVSKAVTRTPFSELVPLNLSQRHYFINAIDSLKSWPTRNGLNFYIESIKSYNTGKGETAISFHNAQTNELPVTVITAAIPSLYKQVLPKDVEFLIINNSGKVLYHSKESKNLHENFLDESDFNVQLKSAMDLRTEDIIHLDYNEKEWLARIVPLEDTPLYHVTLIDLNYTENKNARIFLFTFYFLIVSLIVVGIGMLIIKWVIPEEDVAENQPWFLSWLLFQPEKYSLYNRLSIILVVIVTIQFLGFGIITKPIGILLYQIIFIVYTSFVSIVFLKRKELDLKKLFKREYLPENLILFIVIFSVIVFLFNFYSSWTMILSVSIFLVLTVLIPVILRHDQKEIHLKIEKKKIKESRIKLSYLIFLFIWLNSISVIPVVQFYFSIKFQEEQIWSQEQFFTVAKENLKLYEDYKTSGNTPWFKRIQGNGIDSLKIDFLSVKYSTLTDSIINLHDSKKSNVNNKKLDEIYASMPDPITNGYGINVLPENLSNATEWVFNDTLYYTKGGKYGAVYVTKANSKTDFQQFKDWISKFWIAIVVIGVFIWFLLKYIASVILNLKIENWQFSKSDWIDTLFKKPSTNRIILQSFNDPSFLKKSVNFINQNKNRENQSILLIKTNQLADADFKYKSFLSQPNVIIWINGFDQIIYENKSHELLLTRLFDIDQSSQGKVVIELPFDIDKISEFYDDHISGNELDKEKLIHLNTLKKRWESIFNNYIHFNGFKPPVSNNQNQFESDEETKIQYSNIWNNLTGYEKIVLYDLADDGLVNIKNKRMIKHLIGKNLIILKPYPKLFSDDFKDFIIQKLNRSDIKVLENKIGMKGKWKNTRYLILFIMVPLAAFIFISQGVSFEKIFAIFGGVLTIATGAMRLFDSSMFKKS